MFPVQYLCILAIFILTEYFLMLIASLVLHRNYESKSTLFHPCLKGGLLFYIILSFAITLGITSSMEGFKKSKGGGGKKRRQRRRRKAAEKGNSALIVIQNNLSSLTDELNRQAEVLSNYENNYLKQILSKITQVKQNTSEL